MGVEYSTRIWEGVAFTVDEVETWAEEVAKSQGHEDWDPEFVLEDALTPLDPDLRFDYFGNWWSGANKGWVVGVKAELSQIPGHTSRPLDDSGAVAITPGRLTRDQHSDLANLSALITGDYRIPSLLLVRSVF